MSEEKPLHKRSWKEISDLQRETQNDPAFMLRKQKLEKALHNGEVIDGLDKFRTAFEVHSKAKLPQSVRQDLSRRLSQKSWKEIDEIKAETLSGAKIEDVLYKAGVLYELPQGLPTFESACRKAYEDKIAYFGKNIAVIKDMIAKIEQILERQGKLRKSSSSSNLIAVMSDGTKVFGSADGLNPFYSRQIRLKDGRVGYVVSSEPQYNRGW